MHINNISINSSHLRRTSLESLKNDEETSAASTPAVMPLSLQPGGSQSGGNAYKQMGDKASEEWRSVISRTHGNNSILSEFIDKLTGVQRATELFKGVDTGNPTLISNQGGFDVNASHGPEDSTYLDLGNGVEVFIMKLSSGELAAFNVENGEIVNRISGDRSVHLGNGIYITTSESPSGASEINISQGGLSVFNLRPPTMTLNSDGSMLTIKNQGSGLFGYFKTDVNSFDIQSGDQIVTDGVADIDNMSLQQQFDYYADTPEGKRILSVEGNINAQGREFYDTDVEKRLLVARVQYLRGEGGPELFNEFTPHRASLEGAELVAYDAAVKDMMNEIRDQGVYTKDGEDLDTPLDESVIYMLASAAVEAYGHSPESMEAIMSDLDKWMVSIDNADGVEVVTDSVTTSSAGWYQGGTGTVQFNLDNLVWDYANPNDQFELVTHELAHSLDNVDGVRDGILDGIPPGLSDAETQIFIAERERLFELAYGGEVDSSENLDHNTVENNSGFSNYTFRNRKEFFAELTTTFLSSDEGAEIVKDASPQLYNMLREYYGREDLPAAVVKPTRPTITKPTIDWPIFDWPIKV